MNVALAHHWLTHYRGGEKVLEHIAALFPQSNIYTLISNPELAVPGLRGHRVITSFLNRIPNATRYYKHLLPIHPSAIKRVRVPEEIDLLLSTDAALMKGISCHQRTKHVCYCHSPPRYLWELSAEYKKTSLAARVALDRFAPMLRRFDYQSAQKVTSFIANSQFVADRIQKYYDRDSTVVYPPVAVEDFTVQQSRESFALVISELVPYKRIDIAVEAFNQLGRRLVVIGDGPERKRLESIAGANIEFLGRQPFSVLKRMYESAAMFVFPGIEDFGITPVEAQAAGCPVLAFRAGGALETVVENQTGLFFDEQNGECLAEAVKQFADREFDPLHCRSNAENFSSDRFREQYLLQLSRVMRRPGLPAERNQSAATRKRGVA